MKKILFFITFILCLSFHAKAQNTVTCPCSNGTTCTVDGGLVTVACGIPTTTSASCPSGALYSYASTPSSTLNAWPQPCMDVYYNTADGIGTGNKNRTLIAAPLGGNANVVNINWCPFGGSNPASGNNFAAYGLVDGTAFANTPAAGKHLNLVCIESGVYTSGSLTSAYSAGATTINVSGLAGGSHYWPQGGTYTICIDVTNQECIAVTSQTGSVSSQPYVVNLAAPLAFNHAASAYVWAEDSVGNMGPTYPYFYEGATCDYARAMSYLNGQLGNKQYIFWSISGTTSPAGNVLSYGKYIESLAAPQGCGVSSPDTTWEVILSHMVSPLTDFGIETVAPDLNNIATGNPCASESYGSPIGPAYFFIAGPWCASQNSCSGGAASVSPTTYNQGNVVINSPIAATTNARNISMGGCYPHMHPNNCTFTSNTFDSKVAVEAGMQDNSNPCQAQAAWGYSAPGSNPFGPPASFSGNSTTGSNSSGALYNFQASVGHGANYDVNASGGSNCLTGAAVNGLECNASQDFIDLVKQIINLDVHANVSSGSGVTSAF